MAKILVVNEDAALFERIQSRFQADEPGFEVFAAISGPRAIGMAQQRKPDVIIVDGDMVGLDGYALTQQLKADPELANVPVIILADEPSESTSLKARQSGASAHLPESVDLGVLLDKVRVLAGVAVTASSTSPEAAAAATADYGAPQPVQAASYGAPQPVSAAGESRPVSAPKASSSGVPHIDDLLRLMIDRGGSDLHINVGSPPGVRQRGELLPIEGMRPLSPKDTQEMILSMLSEEQRKRFEVELELDFAYSIPGLSRFRANVLQQRNSMGAVFRVIPLRIPSMADLNLPKVCKYLAERPRGLVLVTGPTGSGKSTTLAAMVDHINETRAVHIITMEDPIEFMHKNKKAYVNQREVGEDTHSFASALKRVLRQDPDVILVGEMRDLETISAAITAAETGHLVFATLHTTGGPETIDRVIDVFPPHQQQQVRMQLSGTLEGVLSQVLLRSTDGKSRVLAMEIMLGIPAISNLIREGKTHQMATIIQGGAQLGMQTLDQHLKTLLQGGKITYEEAIAKAKEPRELAAMLGRKL
ncbi:MAG: PilT/PilU family type 4a pilus ATPase [Coriobacteriia bacterium]|nr:PilT/PilU family type 4a pilus ATPase [Coriobacteriia bacterium]